MFFDLYITTVLIFPFLHFDFESTDLYYYDFWACSFKNCNFHEDFSLWRNCNFQNLNLNNSMLITCELRETNWNKVRLQSISFSVSLC
jgi:uncharacterized protein YjbI with pentapeptide repeats